MVREPLSAPEAGSMLEAPSMALARLYQRWRKPLVRLLQRRLGNANEAEDTAQQLFTNLLVSGRLPEAGKEGAFLSRSSSNLVIDSWRKSGADRSLALVPLDDCPDEWGTLARDAEEDPLAQAQRRQYLSRLEQALAELPERQREAFTLNILDGLTQREAAERMGISLRMVSKHISRAYAYCELRLRYGSLEQMRRLCAAAQDDDTARPDDDPPGATPP